MDQPPPPVDDNMVQYYGTDTYHPNVQSHSYLQAHDPLPYRYQSHTHAPQPYGNQQPHSYTYSYYPNAHHFPHGHAPEPYRAQSHAPLQPHFPHTPHGHAPEPYRAQSDAPLQPHFPHTPHSHSPEPYRAQSDAPLQPHFPHTPYGHSPEPYRAQSHAPLQPHFPHGHAPEPYRAQSDAPLQPHFPHTPHGHAPEPYRAQSHAPLQPHFSQNLRPEPYRAQPQNPLPAQVYANYNSRTQSDNSRSVDTTTLALTASTENTIIQVSTSHAQHTTSTERKDRKHLECLKARRQRKMDKRAAGKRDCPWKIYGCEYIIPVPDREGHNETCKYKCDKGVDALWKEVIKYQNTYYNFNPDIWSICAPRASQFTTVGKLDKTRPLKDEPFLFEPGDFWKMKPPSESQISLACFRAPLKHETFLSPQDADYLTISHQLTYRDHDPRDVQFAVNVQSPELDNFELSIPSVLEVSGDHDERVGYIGYNITPIHSFVDMHVDRGQDTVCIGVGGMEKIWLLWPPTEHNEKIFYSNYYKGTSDGEEVGEGKSNGKARLTIRPKISATAPNLEFGKIVKTTSDAGMWVPSGWIHCVLTTTGGFLAGYTWSTPGRIDNLLACLEKEIQNRNTVEDLYGTVELALSVIQCELVKKQPTEIEKTLNQWIKLIALLNERDLEWGDGIEERTNEIIVQLSQRDDGILPEICPCIVHGSKRRQTKIRTHILSHVYIPVLQRKRGSM